MARPRTIDIGGAFTDRLLEQADLRKGADALDIGCGSGDVTLRLAKAVGDQGRVLGIDVNASALDLARHRAEEAGLTNVTFEERNLEDFATGRQQFDIVTCRRVLMYLPDQVAAAKTLRAALRNGGCLAIHEHDASIVQSSAPLPLYERARSWMWETVRAEGANTQTGFDLYGILSAAGFSDIAISAEAIVLTPQQVGQTAQIVEAIADRIDAAGVATHAEMDTKMLKQRLIDERRSLAATTVGEIMFGAIARP